MLVGDAAMGAPRIVNGAAHPAKTKAAVSNRKAKIFDRARVVWELCSVASTNASPITRRKRSFLININFEAERPRIAGILATADVNDSENVVQISWAEPRCET